MYNLTGYVYKFNIFKIFSRSNEKFTKEPIKSTIDVKMINKQPHFIVKLVDFLLYSESHTTCLRHT